MLSNYICALDIGSSKISGAVAKIKGKRITSIFFESAPSKGIGRGKITDSIDLISSISRVLKNLKNKSGINIKFIYTNISGLDVVTKHSRAIIPLAERGNKVVTLSDIENVNEQARILGSSLEEEIIHAVPSSYAIDSNNNILNPFGLYSHRLEVDLYLICGKLSSLQSFIRVVNQAGYEVKDLFFSGIATSEAVFNKESKEGVNILCDIGSDITELLIFKDGRLTNLEILPLGGDDLTEHIQDALKIPFDLAESVKMSYANALDRDLQINQDRQILVKKDNIYKPIKQKLISEIVSSKTKLICQSIKEAVERNVAFSEINSFVTAGRTSLLEGFLEALENSLGISVKIGRIPHSDITPLINKEPALSGQKYLAHITSLGLIHLALYNQEYPQGTSNYLPTRNIIFKAINKARQVYREYF